MEKMAEPKRAEAQQIKIGDTMPWNMAVKSLDALRRNTTEGVEMVTAKQFLQAWNKLSEGQKKDHVGESFWLRDDSIARGANEGGRLSEHNYARIDPKVGEVEQVADERSMKYVPEQEKITIKHGKSRGTTLQ